jgi:hypothetical protein
MLQFESGSTAAFALYRLTGIFGLTIKSKKKVTRNVSDDFYMIILLS